MKQPAWTMEEDDILRSLYSHTDNGRIAEDHLPGRSERAIMTRAARLGLHKAVPKHVTGRQWTPDELAAMEAHYETNGPRWLHENELPTRSVATIMTKANKMGLHTGNASWTPPENDIVRQNYGKMPARDLAKLLPGRSATAVVQRAEELGLSSDVTGCDTIYGATVHNGIEHGTNVGAHRTDKPRSTNKTTGIRGVCWDKRSKQYIAHMSFKGKKRTLGYFKDINDAIAARRAAEQAIEPEIDRIAEESSRRARELFTDAYKHEE